MPNGLGFIPKVEMSTRYLLTELPSVSHELQRSRMWAETVIA